MFKQMILKIKDTFKNFDKMTVKLLKYGLEFCLIILAISVLILITYLCFIHSLIVYEIGILVLQISLYYAVYCVASAFTIDSIQKKLI